MRREGNGFRRSLTLAAVAFAAICAGAAALIGHIGGASSEAEARLVQDAVRSAALTCYAVEGGYPLSLEYLQDNYGLAYDAERFIVVYDAFASNLPPEIRVLERGTEA